MAASLNCSRTPSFFLKITYGPHQGQRSVDWFAIFDDCVVLVEVKSTRPTEPVRLADSGLADALGGILSRAIGQLNKSAGLIRARDEALDRHPGRSTIARPDCHNGAVPHRECS